MPRRVETGKVDGAEVAGFVGQQRLFPAGVRALDFSLIRCGVVAVDAVEEDDARIAALPCLVHQQLKNVPGLEASLFLAACRVDQGEIPIGLDRLHEGFRNAHGKVEIVEFSFLFLGPDEF